MYDERHPPLLGRMGEFGVFSQQDDANHSLLES